MAEEGKPAPSDAAPAQPTSGAPSTATSAATSAPATPAATSDPDEARKQHLIRLYGATGLTTVLFFASFHPLDKGLLAYVCLVPLLVVALRESWKTAALMGYAATFLGHVAGLAWIALVSALGWLVTSMLEGGYTLGIVLVVRELRNRFKLPLTLTLAPLWVAGEYSRGAHLWFMKFPWLLLGQTQHARTNLIQIADLASVYGISFLVVLVNAVVADAVLLWEDRRREGRDLDPADLKRLAKLAAWPLGLIALANVYGLVRSSQVESSLIEGPRILAVQTDVPQDLELGERSLTAWELADLDFRLTRAALATVGTQEKDQPDAVIWTETTWPWPINTAHPDESTYASSLMAWLDRRFPAKDKPRLPDVVSRIVEEDDFLFRLVERSKCDFLVGAMDHEDLKVAGTRFDVMHNSIYQIGRKSDGTVGVKERYDKCNLVPASEGIPGKDTAFDFFYKLIKSFVPEGFVSFDAGKGPRIMTLANPPHWKLSPDICFEVSFPELVADGVRQGADVLVCPSNDGWFHSKGPMGMDLESAEIPLAFDHAMLRAIETRRGMVRVVNRGITCFIDPLGRKVQSVVGKTRLPTGERIDSEVHVEGFICDRVPTTKLTTVYVAIGDAFAWLTWLASFVLIAGAFPTFWTWLKGPWRNHDESRDGVAPRASAT